MTENDFEKDTNELLANSVFGRSIQTKEMKKIYTLLQIKIWEINMFLQYTMKCTQIIHF